MMRKIMVLCIALLLSGAAYAQKYKILLINTVDITIDGKALCKGDEFDSSAQIHWQSETQAIKVLNLDDKSVMLLVAKEMRRMKCASIKDYIIEKRRLSVRSGSDSDRDVIYLMDEVFLPLDMMAKKGDKFILSFRYMGKLNELVLQADVNGRVQLMRSQLKISRAIEVPCELFYLDEDTGEKITVSEEFIIFPITESI